jgi:hypothetical protein
VLSVEHEHAALVDQRRREDSLVRLGSSQRNGFVVERRTPLIITILSGNDPEIGKGADNLCRISQLPS